MILGVVAFVLMFIGDANDAGRGCRWLRPAFGIGILLLTAATGMEIVRHRDPQNLYLAVPALLFFVLLVYSLFFALPAKDAYITQEKGRNVCTTGVYGFCRHPGLLFFVGLYACLYGMRVLSGISLAVYTVLNLLLVIYEDREVFPKSIQGYEEYSRTVPFLFPGDLRLIRSIIHGVKACVLRIN